MKPLCVRIPAALNFSDPAPVNLRGISILLIASYHAAFAADAFRHVEMKSVLFTLVRSALRNSRRNAFNHSGTLRPASGALAIPGGQQKGCALFSCAF